MELESYAYREGGLAIEQLSVLIEFVTPIIANVVVTANGTQWPNEEQISYLFKECEGEGCYLAKGKDATLTPWSIGPPP